MSTTAERVTTIVARHLKAERVTLDSRFVEDLGADSISVVELVMELEDKFDCRISDEQASTVQTVRDLIRFVDSGRQSA